MKHVAIGFVLFLLCGAGVAAQTAPPSPVPAQTAAPVATASPLVWQTDITPYAWVPNLNGQFTFQSPRFPSIPIQASSINVHVGPSSYLANLNFVAMLAASARRGELTLATDVMYLNMSSSVSAVQTISGPNGQIEIPVNTNTATRLRGTIWTIDAGQRLTTNEVSPLEILGGVRYSGLKASVDWNFAGPLDILPRSGSAEKTIIAWDPIIGFRGKLGVGKSWYLPYYIDYGAGTSNTTWQALVGIGYALNWGDILLVNRWLNYNFTTSGTDNVQLVGPALAFRIHI